MKIRTKLEKALGITMLGWLALPGAGAPSIMPGSPGSPGEIVGVAVHEAARESRVERPRAILGGSVHVFRRTARDETAGWAQRSVARAARQAPAGELLARL